MSALFSNIFLGCFIVGFILTAGTFLFGFDSDAGSGGDGGALGDAGTSDVTDASGGARGLPLLNFNSIAIFLTWFGAVGYVLNSEAGVNPFISLIGAVFFGCAGAVIVCAFVNKFLMKGDNTMRASDYYLPGTLCRVTSSIRQGGAGEIVYVQGGTRKTAGARSDENATHPFGQEVVIVRYEKGLAYVRAVDSEELGLLPSDIPA